MRQIEDSALFLHTSRFSRGPRGEDEVQGNDAIVCCMAPAINGHLAACGFAVSHQEPELDRLPAASMTSLRCPPHSNRRVCRKSDCGTDASGLLRAAHA